MKILGYSERGAIKSLMFELGFARDSHRVYRELGDGLWNRFNKDAGKAGTIG